MKAGPNHAHFARRMNAFAELLSLEDLKRFVAIADCGGFREASRQLNLAQPSLSRSIRALERRVGTLLFDRSARGASLTPAGHVLMRHAQIIYADLRHAASELASIRSEATSEIIIGANPSVTPLLLPRAIVALSEVMPSAHVYVVETRPDHLLGGVEESQFELALAPEPLSPVSDTITVDPIASFPYVVMARSDHPLLRQRHLTLADTLDHCWILPEPGTVPARRLERFFIDRQVPEPKGMYRTASSMLSQKLALATGHLLVRPYIAAGDLLASGAFGIVPLPMFDIRHELVAIRRRVEQSKPATRIFLQKLKEISDIVSWESEAALQQIYAS